jgi:hypothetical protein
MPTDLLYHIIFNAFYFRVLYIQMRSADLPRLQPKNSTFTCVPLYLVYSWSIVHLYVFHFILSATGV